MVDPAGKVPLLPEGSVVPPKPVCGLSKRLLGTSEVPPPLTGLSECRLAFGLVIGIALGTERFTRPVWGLSIRRPWSEPEEPLCWELGMPPTSMYVEFPPAALARAVAPKSQERRIQTVRA